MTILALLLCFAICAAGDTVTNLVPTAVPGATFSGDGQTATITVPSAAGAFFRAVIGVSAPSE